MKALKWMCLGIAFALIASFAVKGSLADDSANRAHLGIVQLELERVSGGLRDVTEERMLLPVTEETLDKTASRLADTFEMTDKNQNKSQINISASADMYVSENALDNIVFVSNVGNVDAYVRTWFAFEIGALTEDEFKENVLLNCNLSDWTWGETEYGVSIGNKKYAVVCAEYNGALGAGQTSAPSLLQILLCSEVTSDIAVRLDNDCDGVYEIMVHSQAVSDEGAWSAMECPWK